MLRLARPVVKWLPWGDEEDDLPPMIFEKARRPDRKTQHQWAQEARRERRLHPMPDDDHTT